MLHLTMAVTRAKRLNACFVASSSSMAAGQCIGDRPCRSCTTYLLRKIFFSWGSDFTITDSSGAAAFSVKGTLWYRSLLQEGHMTFRNKMVISDHNDRKRCMLQKKLFSLRPAYWVYTYTPAFEGQASTQTDSGTPVYRFAAIERSIFWWPCRYTYTLCATSKNDAPTLLWTAQEEVLQLKYGLVVKRGGTDGEIVGTVGQTTLLQLSNEYSVGVEAGTDALGLLCLAIVAHQMRNADRAKAVRAKARTQYREGSDKQ